MLTEIVRRVYGTCVEGDVVFWRHSTFLSRILSVLLVSKAIAALSFQISSPESFTFGSEMKRIIYQSLQDNY